MEIEDGIPMPDPRKRGRKRDWGEIPVGKSTFVAGASKRGTLSSTTRFGKLNKMSFVVEAAEKDGVHGVRVWRAT